MKQVININFQGRVVPIEVSAYDILKAYVDSLSRHFSLEDGKDEIINDIENRIGELFQERIKAGAVCITDEDVNAIIKSIGRPEDFDDEDPSATTGNTDSGEPNTQQQQQSFKTNTSGKRRLFRDENHKLVGGVCSGVANYFDIDIVIVRIIFLVLLFSFGIGFIPYIILWIAVPSSATTVIGSRRKKLYRDNDEKYIAGVCSGIGNYLGINAWIPRVLFLLPLLSFASRNRWGNWGDYGDFNFFSFSPGALFIYIILWLVLPEAKTTAEKLEMKGEKVDMNSIKNSVVEEMKGVQERVQKFGKEAVNVANEKGKVFGSEAGSLAKKGGRSLGDIIVLLVKGFVYFILGVVGISLIVALFTFGIAAIGVFPMKDFVLTQGWQNVFAWGTLLFFIITPMIAVITWIIRKLAKMKTGSKMLKLGFSALWVIGWVSIILLIASLSKDFRHSSNINEQEIFLPNAGVKALEVTTLAPGTRFTRKNRFSINLFESTDEDSVDIENTTVHIVKATNDSFRVTLIRTANGNTRRNADTLASLINFNAEQKDSLLVIDEGITINKVNKFRNQHVIITVYVPVGKQIKINDRVNTSSRINFSGPFNNNWDKDFESIKFENLEDGWSEGEWYTMTKDGLFTKDGKPADSYRRNNVEINSNGIDVRDGNGRVRINRNGITIDDNKDGDGNYRYDNNKPMDKFDSIKMNIKKDEKYYKDSLQKEKERIEKQLEKYDNREESNTFLLKSLPFKNAMVLLN
jgi:phage shock protein PspC (stress-responsive transcriptional regulator)